MRGAPVVGAPAVSCGNAEVADSNPILELDDEVVFFIFQFHQDEASRANQNLPSREFKGR